MPLKINRSFRFVVLVSQACHGEAVEVIHDDR